MRSKMVILLLPILFFISVASAAVAVDRGDRTYDVIIVGGGIAGLTAAFSLADYDLLLLEKEKQVGGRATSGQYQGISYARGTEYLGKPEAPLAEIISTLGLTLREIPAPADVVSHRGRMFFGDYGKARLLTDNSSLGEFNRFAEKILTAYEDYDDIPDTVLRGELQRLDTITARQWFAENSFAPIYSDIYNVTFRGLFGANIDEISALSALPELAFDFEGFERLDEDDDLAEEYKDDRNSTGMYSFDRGIAEIPLAIASHLGDRLRTGTTVTAVERTGDLFAVTCAQAGNTRITYRAKAVILATPSAITLNIAGGVLGEEQRQILGSVSYAPYVTIALFSEAPIFNQAFDLAVPDGLLFTDIYDATWIARHFNAKANTQQSWVTLLYVAPVSYRNTALLSMQDQELMSTALTQLDRILPGSSGLIKKWEITRFRYGYPVMTPGSYQRMTRLQAITGGGLYLAGDYLVYPTFEAAASSGQLAARRVMDWFED
ncbi:MAG: FAD-dependent oxidoreductase [Proteobacteria bacterium]|nr:FAD-dependent oxidoreductase [Pseudomonadota bacterium]